MPFFSTVCLFNATPTVEDVMVCGLNYNSPSLEQLSSSRFSPHSLEAIARLSLLVNPEHDEETQKRLELHVSTTPYWLYALATVVCLAPGVQVQYSAHKISCIKNNWSNAPLHNNILYNCILKNSWCWITVTLWNVLCSFPSWMTLYELTLCCRIQIHLLRSSVHCQTVILMFFYVVQHAVSLKKY